MLLRVLGVALLVSVSASAQDGGVGVLTKPPALLTQVEAAYPPDMADAGVGGTVTMEIDVGPDGRVSDARVVGSAGQAFDESALAAVRQFTFSPAEVDGQPAAVRLQYRYEFFMRQEVVTPPPSPDAGPVVNFSGTLIERGTRLPLFGAQVVAAGQEVVSDEAGHFSLADVPAGEQRVVVIHPDYQRYEVTENFVAGQKTQVTYYVRRKVYGGYETVVRAQRERKEVTQIALKQEEIRLIPGTNGDAFRVVQNLPGVARSPFGLGQLVVRGGKGWDTRTYVDDIFIPQLFHFGGLYATFNSSLLQELSFSAGNFGAEYGRAIGGLVKADVRTPSKKGFHGYVDVNLVDASAMVELPIGKDWSVSLSGRRSYIDALLPFAFDKVIPAFAPQAKNALSFTVAPRYYDYQLRVEYRPPKGKSRFFVSFYGSDDKLALLLPNAAIDPEGRGTFGTSINYNRLTVGFDYDFSRKLKLVTRNSVGLDRLEINAGSDLFIKGVQYPIQLREMLVAELFDWLTLTAGIDAYIVPLSTDSQSPPLFKPDQIPDPFISRQLVSERASTIYPEPGVFAEATFKPVEQFKAVAGVRGDYDTTMKKGWVDPRLALFYAPYADVTFKGGLGLYHQPPDYRIGLLSQKFGNPDLQPEAAWQYMLGLEKRFSDAVSLDVQGYYKALFNQARQTLVATSGTSMASLDPRFTSNGYGRSYGLEILLRHQLTKNFFGWVSYSLSRTERDFQGGKQYGTSQFDQPHNLIVILSYKLPFDFIVGARMRYVSGPLNTPVVGAVYDANGNYYFPLPGEQFSRRLPDFFQLDVRIDKRFVFRDWMLAAYLDVQNVTNRQNVEGVLNNFNYTKEAYLSGLPILPVLGLRAEW